MDNRISSKPTQIIWDDEDQYDNCLHRCVRPDTCPKQPKKEYTPAMEFPYKLDAFQQIAVDCLEGNESVLISAHTSAGKTTVAEYAIAIALRDNQRLIYTAPIKALSNQKYRDFLDKFQDVGLMTGDVTVNPSASIMVMTTEILRSMLYAGSELCREMAWVVFDEVHYLADKERGVIWEETMILCPDSVRMLFLSATIPNAAEFADWICRVKHQPCHMVYTEFRPTPLRHYVIPVGATGASLVVDEKKKFRTSSFKEALDTLVNSSLQKTRTSRDKEDQTSMRNMVRFCNMHNFFPVIVFNFAKRDCEKQAQFIAEEKFTDEDEEALIDQVYENAIGTLSEEDQLLQPIIHMRELAKRGIAVHHSGLLPIVKEIVEILFGEGLIKVLFTTETFAMGLNMPARSVVFKSLYKFDGQSRRCLTAGEYTQMSGRAGRRGKDATGDVFVMLDKVIEKEVIETLMLGNTTRMLSQFKVSFNMMLNIMRVDGVSVDYLVENSFSHHQSMVERLRLKSELKAHETELANIRLNVEEIPLTDPLAQELVDFAKSCSMQASDVISNYSVVRNDKNSNSKELIFAGSPRNTQSNTMARLNFSPFTFADDIFNNPLPSLLNREGGKSRPANTTTRVFTRSGNKNLDCNLTEISEEKMSSFGSTWQKGAATTSVSDIMASLQKVAAPPTEKPRPKLAISEGLKMITKNMIDNIAKESLNKDIVSDINTNESVKTNDSTASEETPNSESTTQVEDSSVIKEFQPTEELSNTTNTKEVESVDQPAEVTHNVSVISEKVDDIENIPIDESHEETPNKLTKRLRTPEMHDSELDSAKRTPEQSELTLNGETKDVSNINSSKIEDDSENKLTTNEEVGSNDPWVINQTSALVNVRAVVEMHVRKSNKIKSDGQALLQSLLIERGGAKIVREFGILQVQLSGEEPEPMVSLKKGHISKSGSNPRFLVFRKKSLGWKEGTIFSIGPENIIGVSTCRLEKFPPELAEFGLTDPEKIEYIGKAFDQFLQRVEAGYTNYVIDPYEVYVQIDKPHLTTFDAESYEREVLMLKNSPVPKLPTYNVHCEAVNRILACEREIARLQPLIQKNDGPLVADVTRRQNLLVDLGFADAEGTITLKGQFACGVTVADEINIFNDLDPATVVAVLSCLSCGGAGANNAEPPVEIEETVLQCGEVLKTVAACMFKHGIISCPEEYIRNTWNTEMCQAFYQWMCGSDISTILADNSDIFEGSLIRIGRSLDELVRQVLSSCKGIGNARLTETLTAARTTLRRGLMFSASLYV